MQAMAEVLIGCQAGGGVSQPLLGQRGRAEADDSQQGGAAERSWDVT